MPYTLFQGGRRRPRRRPPGVLVVLALVAVAAAGAYLLQRGGDDPPAPRAAAPSPPPVPLTDTGTVPLAGGGGTAPAPLAVRLEDSRDAVRLRFHHPPRSGLMFDIDTGRVLWRRDPTRVLPIASLTKMMTALLVADLVPKGSKVLITKQALHYTGSGVGMLPRGRRIGVNTMLYGLLLPSG